MRITILQGAFLPVPPIRGGAVEKVWFALGQEFASRGHQVTHISRWLPELAERETIAVVEHRRVRGYDTPRSLALLKWRDLLYTLRAKSVLPDADILVTNTFWAPIFPPKSRCGKVYVHVARFPKGQFKFYRSAARLQPVSTHIARAIAEQAPALASRVKAIPNPLPMREITALDRTRNEVPVILFVGRLHPEKGVHFLLDAFLRMKGPARLKIVGPWEEKFGGGGSGYHEKLLQLAGKTERSVEFTGAIFDPAALNQAYASADLFVYPSVAGEGEALPLAPVESMANGCPPLVSRLECFDDYLVEKENGFFFDHTGSYPAKNLAATLDQILGDRAQLARVAKGCLETARRFTLPRVADLYLADFESLLRV